MSYNAQLFATTKVVQNPDTLVFRSEIILNFMYMLRVNVY